MIEKNRPQLNVLLGAGFSRLAGLPLVKDINRFFNRRIYDELRVHSSSEWFWKELAEEVANHNGSLNSDHIVYAFIIEEIMKTYGELKNYEDFYDFLIHQPKDWYKVQFDTAKRSCQEQLKLPDDNHIIRMFESYQYGKIIVIFNYLIIDTLRIKEENGTILDRYSPFLSFLEAYKAVRIFTLNHDLLLEHLFSSNEMEFSDGFSETGSVIFGDGDEPQPSFKDAFVKNIHVLKLHGSASFYGYPVGNDDGGIIYPTGQIIYFKPTSHSNKHTSRRIDHAGKTTQSMNLDPVPKFITGRDKARLISKDEMYSCLYARFEREFKLGSDLLIIGYSFGDDHVNKVLKGCGPYSKVINVNPSITYPFPNSTSIINLSGISELTIDI